MEEETIVLTGKVGRIAAVISIFRKLVNRPGSTLFLRNFSVTFIFKTLSLLLTLVVYVISIRELGVITWGQIALIGSVANIMLIPLTFGLHNGVIKYVPVSSADETREIMGTALIANLVPSSILTLLLVIAGPTVEIWFGFPLQNWIATVALAMSINMYILTESFLRGQQMFFRLGMYKLLGSVVFLGGTLFGMYVLGVKSMSSYMIPLIAQNVFFFVSALVKSGLIPLHFSLKTLKKLFSYGLLVMLSWLMSALLFTSDLFLVAHFGAQYDLGVYSVYQNTIRNLCTILFHDVFAVVFMPMVAAMNRRKVDRMIMKFSIPIFIVVWLGAAIVTTVLILLYGKSIPLDWLYVCLTSAGIAMNMLYLLISTVISLDGVKAAKWIFTALIIPIPAMLYLQYLFVKQWGMIGGMSAVILLNVCLVIVLRITVRYFYQIQSASKEGDVSF
ncbi:oligosaccharide flippase family protein [Paenibacillus endoradicis]|uniref:oligosaccharide flippase family protein n=1 Tax=Paenibacillus endoradicis TaxID=2972487 RepID=UPI0021599F33|nr:oligosaccharide flippase family protein [Paenibacillus endoradicis]MCR8656499.1 oligosaccharide flippase family protein [Paenibacillus endoradicis]